MVISNSNLVQTNHPFLQFCIGSINLDLPNHISWKASQELFLMIGLSFKKDINQGGGAKSASRQVFLISTGGWVLSADPVSVERLERSTNGLTALVTDVYTIHMVRKYLICPILKINLPHSADSRRWACTLSWTEIIKKIPPKDHSGGWGCELIQLAYPNIKKSTLFYTFQ